MVSSEKLVFKPAQVHEARGHAVKLDLPILKQESAQKKLDDVIEEENQNYLSRAKDAINADLQEYQKAQEAQIAEALQEAKTKLEQVREEGKSAAFAILQEAKEKAKRETETVRLENEQLVERAKLEVERMVKAAEMRVNEIEHEAYQKGYDAGRDLGFKDGEAEIRRLVDRLGTVIGRAIDIRGKLVRDSEKQMVDMVLMIARKVVKDEIAERKEIVINNIHGAIKRIQDKDRIDIRVNFADLDLTTAHKEELIKLIESLREVNIYEDSRIERGGCIIETNTGAIDARISTQFKQIEEAVRNMMPLASA